MKALLLALLLVPALALAADEGAATGAVSDPMAGWTPPKVKHEAADKQQVQALLHSMDAAMSTGDLDAATALVDFPVMMMTDDSKGQGMGEPWDREKWTSVMKPLYAHPAKDMKVTHKPSIFLLSDSLAVVDDVATMKQGGKSIVTRSSLLAIRKDGKWRVKSMAEGGWGDTMGPAGQGTAASPPGPASQGTGSGASEPPAQPGPGGAAAPAPTERTTK